MPDSVTGLSALDALTLDEDASPASPETPPVETSPSSDPPVEAVETPSPNAAETPDAPSPEVPPLSEPPAPEPYPLVIDGKPLSLDGVVKRHDGVLEIPEAVWQAEIAKKYLANRDTWAQKEGGYRRKIDELTQRSKAHTHDVERAGLESKAAMRFVNNLIDTAKRDPVQFAETLDRLIAEMPAKVAEAKLAVIQERDERMRDEQERFAREQEEEAADQQLASFLDQEIRGALTGAYKDLAPTATAVDEVVHELIGLYGTQVLAKLPASEAWQFAVHGWQVLGQVGDQVVGFSKDKLTQILDNRVTPIRGARSEGEKLAQAKARNAHAVKPTPPPIPPPTRPRDETGKFAKADEPTTPKGRRRLEELTME